jgi:hypothetical protein
MRRHHELRRHPRFDGAALKALLKVDGRTHAQAVIENLSLGGACVRLSPPCAAGKNVLLEVKRGSDRGLRLVGRVIAQAARGRGVRIRFNPSSAACTAELHALLRGLGGEEEIVTSPTTDPEAYEFRSLSLPELELETQEMEFDIDEQEPELELVEVVEAADIVLGVDLCEEPTVQVRAQRIEELERRLDQIRRNARTLLDLEALAS